MVDASDYAINAWFDTSKGMMVEVYYKFLNNVTNKDVSNGSLLKIGEHEYLIISWDLSKESGNPIFNVKGFMPAVERINEFIKSRDGQRGKNLQL